MCLFILRYFMQYCKHMLFIILVARPSAKSVVILMNTSAARWHASQIFMIRRSFQDLSKSAFIPFIRAISASAPWIWYATLFAKPRCRYYPPRANSKISYLVGNWYASPPLRRETAATGPSFLAAATTSA